ncbi:MAG: hypothetical protein ACXACG_08765 [Candidatus Thorarchaeota archaeon]|jgi:hypothetical protein
MNKAKKITFRRKVPIQTWDLGLSIQKYEEHPVWLAILKLAQEGSGKTSPKKVQGKLLVNKMPDLQAKLLLDRVVKEELLNEDYKLTDEGRDALDKELMPVRMRGLFTTSFVDDLLIPQIVLSVSEPHEPKVDGKSLRRNGPARKEIEETEEVPEFIENVIDTQILVNKEAQPITIKAVEEYGSSQGFVQADLTLEFTSSGQTSLRLGHPVNRRLPIPEELNMTYSQALDTLLSDFGEDWNREEEVVLVKFDDTEITERRIFQKSFTISRPSIPGYGSFETVTTPQVKIEPKTPIDAQSWFDWLLVDQLPNKYLQQAAFHEHISKVRVKFPSHFLLHEPDQESVAEDLFRSGNTSKAWLLQAPLDLTVGDTK